MSEKIFQAIDNAASKGLEEMLLAVADVAWAEKDFCVINFFYYSCILVFGCTTLMVAEDDQNRLRAICFTQHVYLFVSDADYLTIRFGVND